MSILPTMGCYRIFQHHSWSQYLLGDVLLIQTGFLSMPSNLPPDLCFVGGAETGTKSKQLSFSPWLAMITKRSFVFCLWFHWMVKASLEPCTNNFCNRQRSDWSCTWHHQADLCYPVCHLKYTEPKQITKSLALPCFELNFAEKDCRIYIL